MKNPRRTLSSAVVLACAALAACAEHPPTAEQPTLPHPQAPAAVAPPSGSFVPGRVIVRLRQGQPRQERLNGARAAAPARLERPLLLERTFIYAVEPGKEWETAQSLAQDPAVEWAEPDYLLSVLPCEVGTCEENGDTFFGYKWDLHNNGTIRPGGTVLQNTGAVDADIDWQEMYDYLGPNFTGSAVIGIVDSGVRVSHQDLAGKVIGQRNFITTDPAQVGNAADDNSHGTHVAGIAAARANNNLGVAGVAYGVNIKLLAIKACNAAGSCPTSASANGIVWAVDNGANVINLSLSGFGSAAAGSALQLAALQYAVSKNVLPVCSTGNDAHKTNPALWNPVYTGGIGYPARFNECFAVGATNWSDGWAAYSNHGPGIDISAPGGEGNPQGTAYSSVLAPIWSSTSPNSNTTYGWKNGTSMAAPQVAGLAAVLYALGETSVAAVRQRIINSADDLGPAGWDQKFGWGRINAYRAVAGVDPDAPPVARPGGAYAGAEGAAVAFDGSQSADPNGKAITFAWNFGDGGAATGAQPSHTYADNGSFAVQLTVKDPANLTHTAGTTATISNVSPSVSVSLSAGALSSGATLQASGGFSDPGVLDAPWSWAFDWDDGASSTGATGDQDAALSAGHRVCGVGARTVRLSVTDKDGGTGSAAASVTVAPLAVALSAPGTFNAGSNGKLPVKVLSTAALDATEIDPATVRLNGAPVAKRNNGTWMASREDVDGDGDLDLVLHFERPEVTGVSPLVLTGGMDDGCRAVRGSVTVDIR